MEVSWARAGTAKETPPPTRGFSISSGLKIFHVAAGLRAAPGGQPADQPLVREGGRREERGQDDPLHFQ